MNIPDKKRVYGDVPDHFRVFVVDALREEMRPVKSKSVSTVLLVAIILVTLSATALAIGNRFGLFDLFPGIKVDQESAERVTATEIAQEGGQTAFAEFHVREVFYDGSSVYFAIEAIPKNSDGILVNQSVLQKTKTQLAEKGFSGEIYGINYSATIADLNTEYPIIISGGGTEEENALLFIGGMLLPEGETPNQLRVEASFSIWQPGVSQKVDSTVLAFTIDRTTQNNTNSFVLDADILLRNLDTGSSLGVLHIDSVKVAHTPVQLLLTIKYRSTTNGADLDFKYVSSDGAVEQVVNTSDQSLDETSGTHTYRITVPTNSTMPDIVRLWIEGTDQELELDMAEESIALHIVSVHYSDDPAPYGTISLMREE